MLILARRPGERVVIGEEILVTVMAVNGHTVRLGIEAPQGVPIFREEIWLAVQEENRAAATADVDSLPSTPPTAPSAAPGAPASPNAAAAPAAEPPPSASGA